jgi:hypothetical protein
MSAGEAKMQYVPHQYSMSFLANQFHRISQATLTNISHVGITNARLRSLAKTEKTSTTEVVIEEGTAQYQDLQVHLCDM